MRNREGVLTETPWSGPVMGSSCCQHIQRVYWHPLVSAERQAVFTEAASCGDQATLDPTPYFDTNLCYFCIGRKYLCRRPQQSQLTMAGGMTPPVTGASSPLLWGQWVCNLPKPCPERGDHSWARRPRRGSLGRSVGHGARGAEPGELEMWCQGSAAPLG